VLALSRSGSPSRWRPPSLPGPPAIDPLARRDPPAGPVDGSRGEYGSHVWRGIPYAAPPVGERRWRAPAPAPRWDAPRAALASGGPCPQLASPLGGVDAEPGTPIGREDCLTLDVYAPASAPDAVPAGDARLPVLVWIHGGGNTIGTSSFYDGGHLAARERVVVVAVNYRLGPFGWFRHPVLAEGATPEERSGNFALLDLVQALRWVRDNAAAFGGDPERVTIFGESAGGTNVVALLASPAARGLFQRAVVQSGGTASYSVAAAESWADAPEPGHPQSSREIAARLLEAHGRAADAASARALAAALPPAELADFLRGLAPEAVLGAYTPTQTGMVELPRVIRDGVVLPADEIHEVLARAEGWNRVPLVLGTNRDEVKLFLFGDPTRVRRWLGLVPRVLDAERYQVEAEIRSRLWKATGADEIALALTSRPGPPVFVYRFDWDEEPRVLGADLAFLLGAAHGFEIPFVFGHFDLGRRGNVIFTDDNEPGRRALAAAMMSYWAEFAATGDPGSGQRGDLTRWQAFDPSAGAPKFLRLDTPEGGGIAMADELVTVERVLAEVEGDPRLAEPGRRCEVIAGLAEWTRNRLGAADADRARCAESIATGG
jgi:para-nitrobenzyl esterase